MNRETSILLIGSSGFLGRQLAVAAARQGLRIHGFDPGEPARQEGLTSCENGSVADRAGLEAAIRRVRPHAVVSLAAFGQTGSGPGVSAERDPDAAFAVNVEGFRKTIEACRVNGVPRLIWTSSTTVLGPARNHAAEPVDEDAKRYPESVYGLTKALAEQIGTFMHRRFGVDVVGVRPTLVLGRNHPYRGILDPLKELFEICAAGQARRHTIRWSAHRFDVVDVRDAAAAILALIAAPGPLSPIYHVNGGTMSIREIARIAQATCPGLELTVDAVEDEPFPLISCRRLGEDVGFRPAHSPEAIIRHCIAHSEEKENFHA